MKDMWAIEERGFLPAYDPITSYDVSHHIHHFDPKVCSFLWNLNAIANKLPEFNDLRCVRDKLPQDLGKLFTTCDESFVYQFIENLTDPQYSEYLMRCFSYFASSFVHAPGETTANRIPQHIALPLKIISNRLKREPILSYGSYCLNNWKKRDESKPIRLGNIDLIQNFTKNNKRDEDGFILIHVDIEAKAAKAISAIRDALAFGGDFKEDLTHAELMDYLVRIRTSLRGMVDTFDQMPDWCDEEVYYHGVRPYIFGFKDVMYETSYTPMIGVRHTLRGETGAQSSVVPVIQTFLGIKHNSNELTSHLQDMRKYMPPAHRDFLVNLEASGRNIREVIHDRFANVDYELATDAKATYDDCVVLLAAFRKMHLKYAMSYIQNKVENPQGTGGTPYIPWLSQLAKETEEYLFRQDVNGQDSGS